MLEITGQIWGRRQPKKAEVESHLKIDSGLKSKIIPCKTTRTFRIAAAGCLDLIY
jgi:hypothetical protein